ncbi:DUF1501 domain-containing protein [Novosphingobium sp. TH158]|uniref:DUF1501 domain-containing protein n=1 Tax=Novosphingobium sp. TH158 TaxID=2067455 RepID=UPI000C7A1894|nr:DUF1501 domain-containing protein [Novosphingobium sp. TH158]PLK25630.1 hypothetical protein C0V78_01015 [Novosphingobium sp. TH158]
MTLLSFDRRHLLGALGASALLPARIAFAAAGQTERRLVFIIQRGAADGLATLAPIGDPAFASARGALAEEFAGLNKLDGMFALHPSLAGMGKLYAARQALFVHGVGIPYRDRSHFDAQNVLETGGTKPYEHPDGWMNRLLGLLPGGTRAMAVAPTVPAAMRGPREVASYANSRLPDATEDLMQRVSQLYAADPQLHGLWESSMQARQMAAGNDDSGADPAATGKLAASLLTGPQGARVAMIETGGWDTHINQKGRLERGLKGLDTMIGALRDGLGPAWSETLVVVATEFGRTVAPNGTGGTDHGTGSLLMLLGGTVDGGRVVADWPGLAPRQLFEGRDLKPTLPIDAALAGALGGHFGVDPARVLATCFPGATGKASSGLIRA